MADMHENLAVPHHVGFIVDGNRRWAEERGKTASQGHFEGYKKVKEVALECLDRGVAVASFYVFSTENWKRSVDEVGYLMDLLVRMMTKDIHIFHERQARLRIAGSRNGLSKKVLAAIDKAEAETADYTGGQVVLCLNYGGQLEIVDAVKSIVRTGVDEDKITPDLIERHLYLPDVSPCDLIVRTSGEQRLSNFQLWRSAYSELMFIEKTWPDMTKEDIPVILEEYTRRGRRFGG